jgi:ABC-type glycerol-3-phosphate transport system substrate-binding protein
MRKVKYAALFLGGLGALSLASCGSSSDSNEVTFYHYGTTSELSNEFTSILADFTEESGIKVKRVPITKDNYNAAVSQKMGGKKNDIDLLYLDQPLLAQYAKSGLIENLSDYFTNDTSSSDEVVTVDGEEKFNQNAFYSSAWSTAVYDGKPYAIPLTLNTSILYYNLTTIKTAGNYSSDDEALEAVSSIATRSDLKDFVAGEGDYSGHKVNNLGSEYALFSGMGDGGYMGRYSQCYVASSGGELFDETTSSVLPNDDGTITDAFEMIKYMYDNSPKSIMNSSTGFKGTSSSPAGKVLFSLADGSAIDDLDVSYTTFGAIKFPGKTEEIGSKSNIGGENLVIPSRSEHKENAIKLAKYLISSECMSFIQECTKNYAAVEKYATIDTFSNDASSSVYQMYSTIKDQLATAQVRPVVKGWMDVNDNAIPTNLNKYIDGTSTVIEAIENIRTYASETLEL